VRAWRLGILIGTGSLVFFGMNGWIASYNVALHRTALTPVALLALNAAQLPVSFALTPFAQQLAGRRWPYVAAGILCVIATVGWLGGPAQAEPFWAAILGGSSAFVFVLGIALPPLLATREQVASLTGVTLMLGYGVAFLGPLVGGALWDVFGVPALAFVPVVAAGLLLIILGLGLPPRTRLGLVHEAGEPLTGKPPALPTALSC
jgi:CP family cyanate transporter-like MFS transporter